MLHGHTMALSIPNIPILPNPYSAGILKEWYLLVTEFPGYHILSSEIWKQNHTTWMRLIKVIPYKIQIYQDVF